MAVTSHLQWVGQFCGGILGKPNRHVVRISSLGLKLERMPAKSTRREPDAQADLIGHATAHAEAFGWAQRAVALRQAGKTKAAQAAERRARDWLRKAMAIEVRYPPITRERSMTKPKG